MNPEVNNQQGGPVKKNKIGKVTFVFFALIVFIISAVLIYKVSISLSDKYSYVGNKNATTSITSRILNDLGVEGVDRKKLDTNDYSAIEQATSTATSSDTQFVILSFDGSRSIDMWQKTRQFAKDMTAKGTPVHFTYFINPIYLITKEKAKTLYQPPSAKMGESMIGYADSEQDVKDRVDQINLAYNEGNEIGSHTVGHFNGSKWSHDQWLQEFNSFNSLVSDVQKNNPGVSISPWAFGINKVLGFRAPELGVNSNLYKVMSEKGFSYDASDIRMPNKFPVKDKNGIWHIGLGIISAKALSPDGNFNGKTRNVLSMDYNFWAIQSHNKDIAKKGTKLWDNYFTEVKDAYLNYFNKNYTGNHAPVVIGHHFSSWNDGVYWEAMKAFAEEACSKPKVKCVTFSEYVNYLNSNSK